MRLGFSSLLLFVSLTLCGTADGAVDLVGGRLSVDGFAAGAGRWQRRTQAGFSRSSFDLAHRGVYLGGYYRPDPRLRLRAYVDVSRMSPLDLCVLVEPAAGMSLTFGQFLLPLGFELLDDDADRLLSDLSLLSRFWKPGGQRDIGAMFSYGRGLTGIWLAVVNGNGWNRFADDNWHKDIAARFEARPFSSDGPGFALRGYFGHRRVDTADLQHRQVGGEVFWTAARHRTVVELQHAVVPGDDARFYARTSAYGQFSYQVVTGFEPVVRIQAEAQAEDRYEAGLTAAVISRFFDEHLRLVYAYSYWMKDSKLYQHLVGNRHEITLEIRTVL